MTRELELVECFKLIELFNAVADQKEYEYYLEGLDVQVPRIFEELTELDNALEYVNDTEVLDGVADVLVTALGLIKKAEKGGFDVLGALKAVCEQNMQKYTSNEALARQWAYLWEEKHQEETEVFEFPYNQITPDYKLYYLLSLGYHIG